MNRDHYGCSRTRNTGTCSNTLTIRRDVIEARVLEGLKRQLMQPAAVRDFVAHFNAELNRLWNERNGRRIDQEAELKRVQRDLDKVVDAIVDGLRTQEIRDRLAALESRKADLKAALAVPAEPMPALHPGIAEVYARKVGNLAAALDVPEERAEASQAMRALIDTIRLVPDNGTLRVELHGELGALLRLCGSGSRNASRPRG
ncbi:MAG: recombinase family protein, partial [Parvibaculum sp.]